VSLLDDLEAESAVLDGLLSELDSDGWELPTPAVGWAIRDQVSHLAYFDETCRRALVDPDGFRADAAALQARGPAFPDLVAAEHRGWPPDELLSWFRRTRADLLAAYATADPKARIPWYGTEMAAASAITARLMETWAHGQDVADALNATWPETARLRHIAHLGVRTLGHSFRLRGLDVPDRPVRVELRPPDDPQWTWGPEDAKDVVAGPAVDFCLVVTQRRNVLDTRLDVRGDVAATWLQIAQAFAGEPAHGRPPRRVPEATS
jgi:uncharacterized protein (TIGR03084 family)